MVAAFATGNVVARTGPDRSTVRFPAEQLYQYPLRDIYAQRHIDELTERPEADEASLREVREEFESARLLNRELTAELNRRR